MCHQQSLGTVASTCVVFQQSLLMQRNQAESGPSRTSCAMRQSYIYCFSNFLLPTINVFNVAFQATTHTTIHKLHPVINKLTKRILSCFEKVERISTSDITATLYDAHSNHVGDAELEIGQDARVQAVAMEEDGQHREVQAFLYHVSLLFEAFICKMMKSILSSPHCSLT